MEKLYTRDDVLKLLEEQRKECLNKSFIKRHEYVNPYSDSDGDISYTIDKDSILNAKLKDF